MNLNYYGVKLNITHFSTCHSPIVKKRKSLSNETKSLLSQGI